MIMDGTSMDVGAVGDLRDVKDAISVARRVLENTQHTLLAGAQARDFAVEMGFTRTSLQTNFSRNLWEDWKAKKCQPNYRRNVVPNATTACGPYKPVDPMLDEADAEPRHASHDVDLTNHDTIAMIAIDASGSHVVAGTSTNGASHKVPGRVGDSPIMGAGSYADSTSGGCGATGDGDVMMRLLPCLRVVEQMRAGIHPTNATRSAMALIRSYYPDVTGALVAVNLKGEHGGAATGWTFTYSLRTPTSGGVVTVKVPPMD